MEGHGGQVRWPSHTAYEGRVCLLALFRSYDGSFLRHPMVRRIDETLIRRTRDLWDWEDGRAFKCTVQEAVMCSSSSTYWKLSTMKVNTIP
ncbi:hypothetical protein MPTK1_4g13570 [Marchantia polymorpha subsp. ruderalis]|uniref:Uncharacterized protein n=2 Tax=Marchantia polymorpha TaxID=3197 RepID=A0AAF6B9K1_MARPO|nr:hypothetical protein MARPO_0070s0003 [Marchantia polymorpha]BBN08685.1 hypothetical protein Mp_4g13570 [Marchantia polymorpha subsp. ruderalis]|eukprot:PTQ35527.1 hypothetical protein MARPO_0070s0003 [Marchantia polymorpha]